MASRKICYIILVTNSILKDTVARTMYVIFAGHKKMDTLGTNVNTLSPFRPHLGCGQKRKVSVVIDFQ